MFPLLQNFVRGPMVHTKERQASPVAAATSLAGVHRDCSTRKRRASHDRRPRLRKPQRAGQRLTDPFGKGTKFPQPSAEEQLSAKFADVKLFPAPWKRVARGRPAGQNSAKRSRT